MNYIFVDCFRNLLISTFWQLEDANLELILEILCKVYQGEVWFPHAILKFSSMVHIHKCLSCASIFRSPSVVSFGIEKVLLMALSGVFFLIWRVNSRSEVWNSFVSCRP